MDVSSFTETFCLDLCSLFFFLPDTQCRTTDVNADLSPPLAGCGVGSEDLLILAGIFPQRSGFL